jgi:hypothetical protein
MNAVKFHNNPAQSINNNLGTTENKHIGHCTHTPESANVEIQWSQRRT